jgi:hypothetical protein
MKGWTYIGKLKNSFICDHRLSVWDIRVYLALKKWEHSSKPVPLETMAKEINITRKKFSSSARHLEELGFIKIIKSSNWDCYKYQIHKKAHVCGEPLDGSVTPNDVCETPLNDGRGRPQLKEEVNKKKEINKESDNNLPDWLDKEAWSEFLQHRQDIKKPLSDLARKNNLKVLERNKDYQSEIIGNTIRNRWTGLFEPKGKPKQNEPERPHRRIVT